MRFFHLVIREPKICAQLTEISGFERSFLQFNNDNRIQLSVEEYQIRKVIYTKSFKMILIPDKGEISAESHYELFDVMHYFLLDNSFIYIGYISRPKFLNIDKIQKILVFERHYSTSGNIRRRKFLQEIIGHLGLVMEVVFLYAPLQILD